MALYPPTFQSYIGYRAFIPFYRKRDTLPFYVRVNPITTLFYSMLWFVPVVLAISDVIGRRRIEWEHTPREGEFEFLPPRPEKSSQELDQGT